MTWNAPKIEQTLTDCIVARWKNTKTGVSGWGFRGVDGKTNGALYATWGGCREAACRAGYSYPCRSMAPTIAFRR